MKRLLLAILVLGLLVGCSSGNKTSDVTKVTVGLTGTDSQTWNYIKEEALKQNIELTLKYFDSYPLPNRALSEKEIDINAFQHHIYLEKEIAEFGYKLTVIGETVFAPLALYSSKITALNQVKDNDKVAIPDDTTNGGRALKLLEAQGFIEIDPAAGLTPKKADITKYNVNLDIVEMTATNIPAILPDVAFAAVNSGVAYKAGLKVESALALEEAVAGDNPYINVIVVRTEDKDNEIYKKIVEIYHTDAVKEIIKKESNGTSVPAW